MCSGGYDSISDRRNCLRLGAVFYIGVADSRKVMNAFRCWYHTFTTTMKLAEASQNNTEYSVIVKLLRADRYTLSDCTSQRASQLWFKGFQPNINQIALATLTLSQASKHPPPSHKELRLTTGVVAVAD
jgi:tRNA A37 N6-isopentenylltransferase MiaA